MVRSKLLQVGVSAGLIAGLIAGSANLAGAAEAPRYLEREYVTTLDESMEPQGKGSSGDAVPGEAKKESPHFKLFKEKGNVSKWHRGGPVDYVFVDVPRPFRAAVRASIETVDEFITPRQIRHREGTDQVNPCTGQANQVRWLPGDGPKGVLASAFVCFDVDTLEIVGFRIFVDSNEAWATSGAADKVDVQNVITHEAGHVSGLEHVEKRKDSCLTMFPFSRLGETQKRTLGWGDKRGLDRLYDTGDDSPGPGCGL